MASVKVDHACDDDASVDSLMFFTKIVNLILAVMMYVFHLNECSLSVCNYVFIQILCVFRENSFGHIFSFISTYFNLRSNKMKVTLQELAY